MKKLLTAAAACAALTFATPAQAYVSQADQDATKGIIQKLRATGVTITRPTICPKGMAGKYDFGTATLMLCPSAMNNEALFVETVAHEAVHAAQHCAQGPLVMTVRPERVDGYSKNIAMAIGNKWAHVDAQTQGLDQEQRVMEYEAYAFESRPTTVLSILNKVCG